MSDKWDELIGEVIAEYRSGCNSAYTALRAAIDEEHHARLDAENLVHDILHICQKYQPAGSPPPGDAQILVSWIMRSLANGVPPANGKSKLSELEAQLKAANEDAERLAKKPIKFVAEDKTVCVFCGGQGNGRTINHRVDCVFTLHRARLAKGSEA